MPAPKRVEAASSPPAAHTMLVQQLFVRHAPQLRAYALALAGEFAAADDVIQETFLTITTKAADFQPETNVLAWSCAIVRLKVLENQRASRRFSPAVVDSLAASAAPDLLREERLTLLMACMDDLPPKALELVRLRYFSEHGPSEIAQLLGRTVAGVNNGLLKARNAIRDCVAKKLAAGSDGRMEATG